MRRAGRACAGWCSVIRDRDLIDWRGSLAVDDVRLASIAWAGSMACSNTCAEYLNAMRRGRFGAALDDNRAALLEQIDRCVADDPDGPVSMAVDRYVDWLVSNAGVHNG